MYEKVLFTFFLLFICLSAPGAGLKKKKKKKKKKGKRGFGNADPNPHSILFWLLITRCNSLVMYIYKTTLGHGWQSFGTLLFYFLKLF